MTMERGSATPWGAAVEVVTLADGIECVGTPSHGGIHLDAAHQRRIPDGIDNFLHTTRWWEEDCDWAVPYLLFASEIEEQFKDRQAERARRILESLHPEWLIKIDAALKEPAHA